MSAVSPLRSHVLAVGISTYPAMGIGWKLSRAAEHACEFAEWAASRGVPPDQIHLFVSSADHPAFAARAAARGLRLGDATSTAIIDFVFNRLPGIAGDLFYMFWAGHGSMSSRADRVLFFEDLSLQTQRAFELEDFFAALGTSAFKRFGTQRAFIDACANRFKTLRFKSSLGESKIGHGDQSHDRISQAFFLAAHDGDQSRDGVFGRAVLDAVTEESAASDVWPPEHDRIVERVLPTFDVLDQRPIQLVWTTATGDRKGRQSGTECTTGDLPASGYVNAAAFSRKLPVSALRRLAAIALDFGALGAATGEGTTQRRGLYARVLSKATAEVPSGDTPELQMLHIVAAALAGQRDPVLADALQEISDATQFTVELQRLNLIRHVRTAVVGLGATPSELREEFHRTISRKATEAEQHEALTLDTMLDELYQISGSTEPQRPVWEFLLRLAVRRPARAKAVDALLESLMADEGVIDDLRRELAREQQYVLSISLSPGDTEEPSIDGVDARLVVAGTLAVIKAFPRRSAAGWNEAQAAAADIIRDARRIVYADNTGGEAKLLIEFLLPSVFLTQMPDQIPLKFAGGTKSLAQLHPLVVRLRERVAQRWDAFNIDEWEDIARRIDREREGTVHWMSATADAPDVRDCRGLVALRFLPSEQLLDIVNAGFPFMAWLRCAPPGDDWAEFVKNFDAWARANPVKTLARTVRALRKDPHVERNLTLLWDDPAQTSHWIMGDVSAGGTE